MSACCAPATSPIVEPLYDAHKWVEVALRLPNLSLGRHDLLIQGLLVHNGVGIDGVQYEGDVHKFWVTACPA